MPPVLGPSPSNCLLGRGAILFDRFTDLGLATGYTPIGNASDLAVDPKEQHATLPNWLTPVGGTYADSLTSRELEGSMKLYEFSRANIALLVGGNEGAYTQAATAVVAEPLTASAVLGNVYQTAKRKIGSVAVKSGATVLVAGTDYVVLDAEKGLIQILATSVTVTPGAALTVDYTPTAITGTNQRYIDVAAAPSIHGRMRFDGAAANGGPNLEMVWYHVVLQGSQLQNLISADFANSVLNFKVIADPQGVYGGTAANPFGRVWLPYGTA